MGHVRMGKPNNLLHTAGHDKLTFTRMSGRAQVICRIPREPATTLFPRSVFEILLKSILSKNQISFGIGFQQVLFPVMYVVDSHTVLFVWERLLIMRLSRARLRLVCHIRW